MTTYRIDGDTLMVKEGLFRSRALALEALRLVYLLVDTSSRWYVVTSSKGMSSIDLDAMGDESFEGLQAVLAATIMESKPSHLTGGRLVLADYDGGSAIISLADVKRQNLPILESLVRSRDARRKRRDVWLAGDPVVELAGRFGGKAVLTAEGFTRGKRRIAWAEVGKIQTETHTAAGTSLLVLPRGRSGGIYDLKRYRYSLRFIPSKLEDLYSVECAFWLDRCRSAADPAG